MREIEGECAMLRELLAPAYTERAHLDALLSAAARHGVLSALWASRRRAALVAPRLLVRATCASSGDRSFLAAPPTTERSECGAPNAVHS